MNSTLESTAVNKQQALVRKRDLKQEKPLKFSFMYTFHQGSFESGKQIIVDVFRCEYRRRLRHFYIIDNNFQSMKARLEKAGKIITNKMEETLVETLQVHRLDEKEQDVNNSVESSSQSVSHKRTDYLEWPDYFMAVAFLSAQRSKDPSSQVGACIVNQEKRIVGIGYNGMPTGCSDDLMPWNREGESILDTKHAYGI